MEDVIDYFETENIQAFQTIHNEVKDKDTLEDKIMVFMTGAKKQEKEQLILKFIDDNADLHQITVDSYPTDQQGFDITYNGEKLGRATEPTEVIRQINKSIQKGFNRLNESRDFSQRVFANIAYEKIKQLKQVWLIWILLFASLIAGSVLLVVFQAWQHFFAFPILTGLGIAIANLLSIRKDINNISMERPFEEL